jgi:hypothetical protein
MLAETTTSGFNPWNLFAGGAAIGLVAGFWDKIKAVAWRALNLFVQQIEIPSLAAHDAIVSYLVAQYRRSRAYDRLYGANYEHHRDGRYGLVPYEEFGRRSIIFWNGPFPFLFANAQEKKVQVRRPGQFPGEPMAGRGDQGPFDDHLHPRHARRRGARPRRLCGAQPTELERR